ncbi:FACT complex subunit [Ophidiomyces ophidiicola]|uniref:FACT complex subunit n=1 Tax=Ophidiomyces ophidiicola TaxID=1387563 RepID=UPI0020C32195|nr:FACT complex subunit [Ophidiomyces ophidiicola]KAI1916133.1 FACT complex subunit [Ophidiomyces ophidiicola]KAI1916943.1 FACT complex subunit [Ophidiomyces ophidiicola]KAI1924922.1 FACT complex subunit [Ophidiomyces ophidiicola]KAI1951750.1 FACT complex subunit [Ophidiomyces ophidiicola]KAI1969641.1 FACT complex subunit [Ophidiomyces ophidiicola]
MLIFSECGSQYRISSWKDFTRLQTISFLRVMSIFLLHFQINTGIVHLFIQDGGQHLMVLDATLQSYRDRASQLNFLYHDEPALQTESFENIYLDLSKQSGKCKLAESGLGWKPSGEGETFTLDKSNVGAAQWSRAAKGYELKILPRTGGVIQLDGFDQEDFERTSKAFKLWYGVNLETREHALRGWNWGKADFGKAELSFNVQNKPAFEIPYSEISNTNLAGRNEVAVEFSLPTDGVSNGTNGQPGSTKNRGKKAGAGKDELVEMRFYIPGTAVKKDQGEEGDEKSADGEEPEEQNAANLFYETLIDKAEIGEVAGDTFATFPDVLHLTPRGRFDIDMYENSLRLRGKTYDYKIQYQSIKKFFLLPKNDDTHTLITLGLDPPLRQGQTRYHFLVMQLKLDDEYNLDLNMTDELLQTRYKDKLQAHYEEPIHQVITKVFRGLSGKKVILPSKDFIRSAQTHCRNGENNSAPSESFKRIRIRNTNSQSSHHQHSGIKCSIKANEGLLFCLDKSFMFVPKPATYIQIENISVITMSRVGGAVSTSRTFDITMTLKGGGDHQFININREEQQPLEEFFKAKNIRFKNEMAEDASALIAEALDNDELMDSSEDDVAGANRGSADEDEESVDEDFQAESESDVAEEYDSAHESSGSGSDAEMEDANDANGPDEEENNRPKKKVKAEK